MNLKFISWNVNGLRAVTGKNFYEDFNSLDADFFCLQETKLQEGQIQMDLPGYFQYWNYAQKKGYSGTAIFTKYEPVSVFYGIGIPEHDTEGRVITLEYKNFFLVTVYTPNSQTELKRLDYRMRWEDDFKNYLLNLSQKRCNCLRRPECCPQRNRYKKSGFQSAQCRFYRRRALKNDTAS